MNEKARQVIEAITIVIGITSGGLSLIGSANKLPSFLLASVPVWLLLVPVAIMSFTILGISKLHLSTQNIEGTSHLLSHLSIRLRKYCKRYGKRIVVYKVLPFEFSRAMFTSEEQRKRPLMDALDSYLGDMKKIVFEGTGEEEWWDRTIYGCTGDRKIDEASWRQIMDFYLAPGHDRDGPDTSEIAVDPNVTGFGFILIGKLNRHGTRPERWMCGYDMYRIVATNNGFIRFGGCLFTTNQPHLDAMERRFENLFKEVKSSIELTGRSNHKVFFETELKQMLCPDETIRSDEAPRS